MRDRMQERSSHALLEEYTRVEEWEKGKENAAANENFRQQEQFIVEEEQSQGLSATPTKNKRQEEEGNKVKRLLQYLSTVAVAGAATVTLAVGTGALSSPTPVTSSSSSEPPPVTTVLPSLLVQREEISYNGYQCLLEIENGEGEYRAVLQTQGETVRETTLAQGETEYVFAAEGLQPEEKYTLRVLSAEDEEVFSRSFTTHSFVVFGRTEGGRSYFTLHEDIDFAYDVGIGLYGADGEDYSSLLCFDPLGESYLYIDAIYQGEYTLEFTEYPPDVEEGRVYQKRWTGGTLTPLVYELSAHPADSSFEQPLNLMFFYQSGDLLPYEIEYIELRHTANPAAVYAIGKEYIGQEGDWITSQTLETMETGVYQVVLYGACLDGEYTVEAPLWIGEITV